MNTTGAWNYTAHSNGIHSSVFSRKGLHAYCCVSPGKTREALTKQAALFYRIAKRGNYHT
jgi:hypothetical protein